MLFANGKSYHVSAYYTNLQGIQGNGSRSKPYAARKCTMFVVERRGQFMSVQKDVYFSYGVECAIVELSSRQRWSHHRARAYRVRALR